MALKDILLLGDPLLYMKSTSLTKDESDKLPGLVALLHESMMEFRKVYHVGRAIAAPQVGVLKRVIYMHVETPRVFINPLITQVSDEMIELWDDCMCFPNLLVRVKRHQSIVVKYFDLNWEENTVSFQNDLSELFQHEYDHLDGILATQRAIDDKSFRWR
jgi:peptide deformylase